MWGEMGCEGWGQCQRRRDLCHGVSPGWGEERRRDGWGGCGGTQLLGGFHLERPQLCVQPPPDLGKVFHTTSGLGWGMLRWVDS